MKTKIKTLSFALIGGLALTTTSCKKEGCMDQNALNFNHDAQKDNGTCEYGSTINIDHMYGSNPMSTDSIYTDSQGTKYKFTRCDFYLSNINFTDANSNTVGTNGAVFLVKLDTTSRTSMLSFGGLNFEGQLNSMDALIGLDSLTNYTTDPATMPADSPLSFQAPSMYWTWASGYIFFAVEGVYDSNGDQVIDASDSTFEMHLGTNNFKVANSFSINSYVSANQTFVLNMSLDYSALFAGFDLANDNTTHTMDNMPLAMALKANLANFISVQ